MKYETISAAVLKVSCPGSKLVWTLNTLTYVHNIMQNKVN